MMELNYFDLIGLLGELKSLKSRIAELEAERRWVPVSERLPEANTPVLTISKDNNVATPIDVALRKRIAGLEGFIDRLVEAGDAMSNAQSMWVAEEDKWNALVKDWKEREK